MQFSMVSSNGMLVKRLSTSKVGMIQLASKLPTSSANENESWTVNSLTVKSDKIGTKNFARLYVGVPIADKMGQKEGQLSMVGLCTLALPCVCVCVLTG